MNPQTPFRRITAAEAAALLDSAEVCVLDTRDAAAFARDRIDGAQRLSSANLEAILRATPKTRPVFIYCYRGNTSQEYAQVFAYFGFDKVYDLIGGFQAWRADTHTLERADACADVGC